MINWLKLAKYCRKQLTGRDSGSRFHALKDLGSILTPSYRSKWPQMDWWSDEHYNHYLEQFGEADGMISDRRWTLNQLLHLADSVPGDTAECGAFSGVSSHIICQANKYATCQGKRHYRFDSFEGLSKAEGVDGVHGTKGDSAYGVEHVQEKLCEFDLTDYYSGWIPDKFSDVEELQFSFVHIDVDRHQAAGDSIAFFYPRMTDGGVILVGDYGITSRQGVTEAVDEFLSDKPERMLRLSGRGGFLLKGIRTQSAFAAV